MEWCQCGDHWLWNSFWFRGESLYWQWSWLLRWLYLLAEATSSVKGAIIYAQTCRWPFHIHPSGPSSIFPCQFDEFNAGNIPANSNQNPETSRVLQMWRDIETSKIWGQFYQAARDQDYDGLLDISEVFGYVQLYLAQNALFCMYLHHSSTDCWAENVNIDTSFEGDRNKMISFPHFQVHIWAQHCLTAVLSIQSPWFWIVCSNCSLVFVPELESFCTPSFLYLTKKCKERNGK